MAKKRTKETQKKIEVLGKNLVKMCLKKQSPYITIPSRTKSNVAFNEKSRIIEMGDESQQRNLFNLNQARKFMQTLLIGAACKELLSQDKTTSIRDIFYHCKHTITGTKENTFDEQSESDPIIEDLEVSLESLREDLGLYAEPKGNMVGPLVIEDNGDRINLSKVGSGGWGVPSIVEDHMVKFIKNDAQYVLLIEKGAVWRRFNEDRYWEKHKCLILHGGGQPPRGVRRMVWRLNQELKLPVYVLVDNDPWGYYIYSVVKQGSINLAFESQRMAVPDAKFIGMSSFDRERFGIDSSVCIKLTVQDERRAKEIMQYPWFSLKREWQYEIQYMLKKKVKLELEALSNKDFSFITEEYLPKKLRDKMWLD